MHSAIIQLASLGQDMYSHNNNSSASPCETPVSFCDPDRFQILRVEYPPITKREAFNLCKDFHVVFYFDE